MPNKTEIRCFKRWLQLKDMDGRIAPVEVPKFLPQVDEVDEKVPAHILVSSQWAPAEDEILKAKIKEYGTQNWVIIAKYLPGRLGRQCRERWHNVLDPSIVRREWTREEDLFILE